MQEEERERKDQYVPDVSALHVDESGLDVDADTQALIKSLGFEDRDIVTNVVPLAGPEPKETRGKRYVPGAN